MQAADSDSHSYDEARYSDVETCPRKSRCDLPTRFRTRRHPPDTGRAAVNRPFSAFGVLLSLLAVTMFAVSSTSRSTTVKPMPERAKRAAVRRPVEYSNFEQAVAADADRVQDSGFGVQEEANVVVQDDAEQRTELQDVQGSKLAPVQIEALEDDVSFIVPEPMDGRSLYDAVYDWVVLGSRVALVNDSGSLPVIEEPVRELSDVEMTGLFQSILSEERGAVNGTTRQVKESGTEAGSLRTGVMLPALQNWVRHQVEGLLVEPEQKEAVEWSEYAEMVDSAQQRQSTSAVVASISVEE